MTALVWRGKCLRMRPGKGSFPGVACSQEAKPAPSGAAARTGDPNRLKPLQQAVVRPIRELEAKSQNGNPGLYECSCTTDER
jgi:hypothetical protein